MMSLTQPTSSIAPAPQTNANSQVGAKGSKRRWQLKLNASLDIREVLNAFFIGMSSQVTCASLSYRNSIKNIHVELGSRKLHSAKYGLKGNGYNLGDIIFSRSERFSMDDLQQLENGLSALFYPLRNALLYKEALDSSLRDTLTELSNRAAFEMAIKREIGMAKRHNQPLSLIVMDIDRFKTINDTLGHQAGDQVLKQVAQTIKFTLREIDQVFRVGGEEFVILLASADLNAAQKVAERAREAVAANIAHIGDQPVNATISLGVSVYSAEDDRDSLFQRADKALYLAKNSGRNCTKTEWDLVHLDSAARA
jgi:diguanylate cyclase (GGDEF)-like protein